MTGLPYFFEVIAGAVLLLRAIEVVTLMGPRDRFVMKPIWWALGMGGAGLIAAPFLGESDRTWVEAILLLGLATLLAVDRRKRWTR